MSRMDMGSSKWKLNLSSAGVMTGLVLALPPLISVGISSLLALKVTEGEIRANIQQAIGDTGLMLANHFRETFQHLIFHVEKEGQVQFLALKEAELAAYKNPLVLGSIKPRFETKTIEMVPEVLDLSIWKKDVSQETPESASSIQRTVLGMNGKFPAFTMDRANLVSSVEEAEKLILAPAFQGKVVISLAPAILGVKKFATLVVPLGEGKVNQVVVAHISLEGIQTSLPKNGMVTSVLLDEFGKVLIRPQRDSQSRESLPGFSQILSQMKSSKLMSGQLNFIEASASGDSQYFGGYSKIGMGQVAVFSILDESEGTVALRVLRTQLLGLWLVTFMVFFTAGYRLTKYLNFHRKKNTSDTTEILKDTTKSLTSLPPQKVKIIALYGSLRNWSELFVGETPENIADSINDYLHSVSVVAERYRGRFESVSGGQSFTITWGPPEVDGTEAWRAVRCALQLRIDFKTLNGLRKVDGQKILNFCMGISEGEGLAARIGPAKEMNYTLFGDVLNYARSLGQISATLGKDLLISQNIWSGSDAKFIGEKSGEAKFIQGIELTNYYMISGYRNEQGQEVDVPPPVLDAEPGTHMPEIVNQEKKPDRWLINNGSQILGPYTAEDIASRLFAQELDFDCECWPEVNGTPSQIKTSGIFSGSLDKDATLWLYDGKIVHGPVSPGFLRTAIGHGAMPKTVFICDNSTINGWLALVDWDKTLFGTKEADSKVAA